MKEKFKNFWLVFVGIGTIVVFWAIAVFFLKGGAWLSKVLYPWLSLIFGIIFWITILILLPLAFFRKSRTFSGMSLYYVSWVFGAHLWITSFLITYDTWGVVAVIIGILIMGIGVVPIALLATLFYGEWSTLGQLVLLLIMTISSRLLGIHLAEKPTQKTYDVANGN